MAGQYFFKSNNRGDTWWMNPTDLTKNINRWNPELSIMGVMGDKPMASKHDGYAASSVATQVRESPSKPGVIWVGTEDGNLQVSQDGGETFTNVIGNVAGAPKGYTHISRIEPSHFDPGTAYVAIDNHRSDDWKPYLFKTTDYGKKWVSVAGNLPAKGNINALREDYDNPEPAVRRHGIRSLRHAGRRQGVEEVHDRHAQRPRGRHSDSPARPRPHRRHARTLHLDRRRHHAARADEAGKRRQGTDAVRSASGHSVEERSAGPAHATNRQFQAKNPQGGTAINVLAKCDLGAGKLEFLQGTTVASTMDVQIKAGMNRFQWPMRGAAVARPGKDGRQGGNAGAGSAEVAAAEVVAARRRVIGLGGRGSHTGHHPARDPAAAIGAGGGGGGAAVAAEQTACRLWLPADAAVALQVSAEAAVRCSNPDRRSRAG